MAKSFRAIALVLAVAVLFGSVYRNKADLNSVASHRRSASIVEKQRPRDQMPVKRKLPSLAHGGIIFFLHVPKTGGTSFRKAFHGHDDVIYEFSNNRAKYEAIKDRVDQWVTTAMTTSSALSNQKIKILEVHARNNPTLLEICHQLQQWRETAARNQLPFFAFTILREPLSFAVSYFNYYHGIQWEKRRFEYLPSEAMTEQNFVRTMHFNPQCLFLTRSEQAYQRNHPEMRQNLTKEECDKAFQCLQANMDWIGRTESLQNETIPLINSLMTGDRNNTRVALENAGPKLFRRQNISSDTLQHLQRMTLWDEEMYHKALQAYKFETRGIIV
jgi:Sulfotransferase family